MARILIVDDEKSIRRTLGEFLRADGHEVIEAEDADVALRQLNEREFDVVVTDIILPRVNGVELLRRIQAAASHVQVVMMTGEPTVETASESLRAGAADYLSSPSPRLGSSRCGQRGEAQDAGRHETPVGSGRIARIKRTWSGWWTSEPGSCARARRDSSRSPSIWANGSGRWMRTGFIPTPVRSWRRPWLSSR